MLQEDLVQEMMGDLLYFYCDSTKFTKRDVAEYFEDEGKEHTRECVNRLIKEHLLGFIPFSRRTIYFVPYTVKVKVKRCQNNNVTAYDLINRLLSDNEEDSTHSFHINI